MPFSVAAATYEGNIMMSNVAKRWGNEREGVITIRRYFSEFLGMKKQEVSQKSYQTYQSRLRIFCEWTEHTDVDRIHVGFIQTEHILEFIRASQTGKCWY